MERQVKIELIPREQIKEKRDCIRITCGDIVAWGYTLSEAIEAFDIKLEDKNMFHW